MIVSPLDLPIAFLSGMLFGAVYKWVIAPRNPDLWYAGYVVVLLLWANLVFAAAMGTAPLALGNLPSTESIVLAVGYPLSYPLWYRLGTEVTFFLVGRTPAEGGSLWIYLPVDYTEEFEPAWRE